MDGGLGVLLTPSAELLDVVFDELVGSVPIELLDNVLDSLVDELDFCSGELESGMIASEELGVSSAEDGESSPHEASKVNEMIAVAKINFFIVYLFFERYKI